MIEAVKVALDPTPRQARMLLSHAGAARFAYNAGLAHAKGQLEAEERPDLSHYALRRWWNASKDVLAPWWAENSKEAYSYGLECLSRALRSFLDSRRGRRKGKAVGFPRFKGKAKATPRFAYTTGSFGLIADDPKALRLPRIGRIHCMEDVARRVGGAHVTRMTVSCHAGRWSASLTVERADVASSQPKGPAVGVDLSVAGMVAGHSLAQAVEDASFGEFRRELEYKCVRTGTTIHVIDRWYPSSKTCSGCGAVKAKLPLSVRTYRCEACGLVIDRDLNAAINIMVAGSAPETLNARGGDVRPEDPMVPRQTPAKREPGGRTSAARPGAGGGNPAMQAGTN